MKRDLQKAGIDSNLRLWLLVGVAGFFLLPWYGLEDFWTLEWVLSFPLFSSDNPSGLYLILKGDSLWILPGLITFLVSGAALRIPRTDPNYSRLLMITGLSTVLLVVAQGLSIGIRGWTTGWLTELFGALEARQYGMGYGGLIFTVSALMIFCHGLASRPRKGADLFVTCAIGLVTAVVTVFVFFPIFIMLMSAFRTEDGGGSLVLFFQRLVESKLWQIDCLLGAGSCGVAVNSFLLAVCVGIITTVLGLCFALVIVRTGFRFNKVLRALSVVPIITPPFVIGLAIILLFGLSGTVTTTVAEWLGLNPTRWVYGFIGVMIAQTLAFTPIAFLVLIGVVESVSPSLEEASQTLRADRWTSFRTVTLPLIRPGLANAFLLGFIESMADFGNPLVLGGNLDVLSTEIFFAIVGAQYDQSGAAILATILLGFTLLAFYFQRFWLGKKSYVTVTGKGDSGIPTQLPKRVAIPAISVVTVWTIFTFVVYGMILYGSVVELWGVNNTLTFKHYITAFGLDWKDGIVWSGAAWDSFWTTMMISVTAAPFTAALGLLTAYLLTRQKFYGQNAFEFGTMLSFAIPGTVIGVSYILAFNVPPIEITGTGLILVISFIFRNMPVGVRAGIASMTQIDKSLDESSATLGASTWATLRHVIMPLLKSATVAALVYSFVRAMTAISAVIFLVSAEYDMATSYIIGRVENNDYGLAIAYSTTLIVVMLSAILLLQFLVGRTKIGRRHAKLESI